MDNWEAKIPEEVIDEWHVYKGDLIGLYQTFLMVTDYKITKLYEYLVMYPERAEEIKADFIEKNYQLMEYREIAREELGKLLDELYEENEKRAHEEFPAYYSQMDEGSNEEKAKDQEEHSPINE